MLSKILFFSAVTAATLAVILLALISPKSNTRNSRKPLHSLSLYIQHPHLHPSNPNSPPGTRAKGAFVFRHTLTEGPENTSRIVGKAQGFVIPAEHFAHSGFNVIYLTLDILGFSGSLSVRAKDMQHSAREELAVVGGTGSFAFARGKAIFAQRPGIDAMYHVKLRLRFPDLSKKIDQTSY